MKTGDAVEPVRRLHGDFEDWIRVGLGPVPGGVRVVDVARGDALPDPGEAVGVLITGSSAMVSARESWSERTADWLAGAVARGLPVLGICYGHQLLAQALGGRVGPNPRGREIGTIEVSLTGATDPLLGILPVRFGAQTTHAESVLELPAGVALLAWSRLDPHHAFRAGACAWGVQFHPEFSAAVMRGYVEARADDLSREGLDPDRIAASTHETPHGAALLRRFASLLHVREVVRA